MWVGIVGWSVLCGLVLWVGRYCVGWYCGLGWYCVGLYCGLVGIVWVGIVWVGIVGWLVLWVGLVLHRWPVIRDEETFAEQQLGSVTDAQVCKDRDEDDDYEDYEEEGLQASFHWFRI